jgi:hypothetical protein
VQARRRRATARASTSPDGLFFGGAYPRAAFAIVRDFEKLPMDDFITLNRRDSLADALAPKAAAK